MLLVALQIVFWFLVSPSFGLIQAGIYYFFKERTIYGVSVLTTSSVGMAQLPKISSAKAVSMVALLPIFR